MDDPTKEFFRRFVEFMSTPRREELGKAQAMNPPDDNIPPLPRLDVYPDGRSWYVWVDRESGPPFDDLETAYAVKHWLENGGWRALNTARREE